jgi:hypothetical protein
MNQEDFKAMWNQLWAESIELGVRRVDLENDLNEVKAKIENIEQTLNYLRPLAGIPEGKDLARLGLTDAIRCVLQESKQRMTANEVRRALQNGGFDLSGYSAPMSSVYTVLARLVEDSDTPVIRHKDGNSPSVSFEWKEPKSENTLTIDLDDDIAQTAEISDEDIPF